jgi:hypothetical protein
MSQLIPSDSLPMGTAPDGRSLSLNLATGRVDLGGVPDPALQPLAAADWDAARVVAVFRGAGFHAVTDDEGDVMATDGVRSLVVILNRPLYALRLMILFRFAESVPVRVRRQTVFRLNQRAMMGRYSTPDDASLVIEQEVPLLAGLAPAQLLAAVRLFGQHTERLLDALRVGRLLG